MNIYGIELRKCSLHYLHMYFYLYLSLALSLPPSLSLPICGALAGLCSRFACAGAENEALNRFNMMPKADMKNTTFINQVGDRKMGLGLAMDSYLYAQSQYIQYTSVWMSWFPTFRCMVQWANGANSHSDMVVVCLRACKVSSSTSYYLP